MILTIYHYHDPTISLLFLYNTSSSTNPNIYEVMKIVIQRTLIYILQSLCTALLSASILKNLYIYKLLLKRALS